MKKALLIAGGIGILALGGYLAYKHFKEDETLEEEISLSEAREIIKGDAPTKYSTEEVDALIKEAKLRTTMIKPEEMEELVVQQTIEDIEEETELRHDPNSEEALEQFIKMELADWHEGDFSRNLLNRLYDFNFIPTTAGDRMTISQIEDYRQEFFGDSRWVKNTSFADVILHYARVTDYNVNRGVRYWAEHFLEVSGLEDAENDSQIMELIDRMNDHRHYYDANGTFGLFGLSNEQLEQVEEVTQRYVDKAVNYEVEFNVFLQGV